MRSSRFSFLIRVLQTMDSKRLTEVTGAEMVRLIASKAASPVEVVEAYLERIERLDRRLCSYITVCREEALSAAHQAEQAVVQGDALGPLHGLPLAVKDQFETKGVLTTAGSDVLAGYVPRREATVVARAKAAGAILLGKLNMTEFAAGGRRNRFKHGQPRNPWDLTRNAGGSSTGCGIAIAASLCSLSLGEDTGGSIRCPAAFTGIVGARPTWGRVSRHGLIPLSWSMDTPGPMTRTVEDAALLMKVIAGYDAKDPLTSKLPVPDFARALESELEGLQVGLIVQAMEDQYTGADVLKAVRAAATVLEELGCVVEEVSLPRLDQIGVAMEAIVQSDGAFAHRRWLRTRSEELGPDLRRRWLAGSLIPAQTYQKAMRVRALFRRDWLRLFERYDVLLSPTALGVAEPIEDQPPIASREEAQERFQLSTPGRRSPTMAAAFAGTPAMTVPCGFSAEHLPIGLQIMTGPFREETMFRVGHAFEQSTEWHTRRPMLPG